MKKIIVLLLGMAIALTSSTIRINADSPNDLFYFNGRKFSVQIDKDYSVIFDDLDSNDRIVISPEEPIEVVLNGEEMEVTLTDNYEETGLVEVSNETGEIELIDVEEQTQLGYNGQAISGSIAIGAGAIAAAALGYMIIIGAAIVLGGVTYLAIDKVIENIKKHDFNKYFPALIYKGTVWIVPKSISRQTAVDTLKKPKTSTYTFNTIAAASIARDASPAGATVIHEIDSIRKKGNIYFYHYHPSRALGSHSFYGLPVFGNQ